MIPGIRTVAASRFDASRSYAFSRLHRSQENRNGFWTARGSKALIRGGMGPVYDVAVAAADSQSLQDTWPELHACPSPRARLGRTAQRDEQVISPAATRMPSLVQIFHPSILHRAAQGQVSRRIFNPHLEWFPNTLQRSQKEFLYTTVLPLCVYSCFTRAA